MIGIYRIKNLINGKCYYGSSKKIEKRLYRHKRELKSNIHINCILQRAWDKYGEYNFLFEIVEECNMAVLLETEQKYLDLQPEYNIGIKSSGGDNLTKNPNKDRIVKKIPVTGLQNKNPKAKADWIEDKIDNERYDDIYFADDSKKNVDAVKKMLRTKDVKWRVQHIQHK